LYANLCTVGSGLGGDGEVVLLLDDRVFSWVRSVNQGGDLKFISSSLF